MNSNTSYHFDADDVALGRTFAVVSQGGRRLLLRNLSAQEIGTLRHLNRHHHFRQDQISQQLFASLSRLGLVLDTPRVATAAQRMRTWLRMPSSHVSAIAGPLQWAFSPAGLILLALFNVLMLASPLTKLAPIQDFAHWAVHVSASDAALTMGVGLASMIVHEFGHAAACLRMTGATGSIRLLNYRGTPAMAADVSSICLTDERGKAVVAAAGAMAQAVFATLVLASNIEALRMGATMALLAAAFSMTPLPNTDGYWLIRDYFNLRLTPALWKRPLLRMSDVVYGYFLFASTAGFAVMLLSQCEYLLHNVVSRNGISGRNTMAGILMAYMFVVSCIFIWKNAKLFFDRQPATQP
jgi:hypothetical protein